MTRLHWALPVLWVGVAALAVGQVTDPSVATFPRHRWAGGDSGVLTEVDSTNRLLVTLTSAAAAVADPSVSVNTFPRVRIAGGTTGNLAEVDSTGHLLVTGITTYTDEEAQDAVGTIFVDSSTIDFTYSDAIPSVTAIVIDDAITYAKMQNVSAASKLLGSGDAGAGINPVEITLGSGLSMSGTTLSSTATISGGAANKVAYWTGATTLSNDTSLHWDSTTDTLGLIATAAGTSGVGVLTLGLGTSPTTGVTDAVQLYARDYAAGYTGLAIQGESSDTIHLLGRSLLTGTMTLSSSMVQGHLIDQNANDDGILQFLSTGDVAHGMTALGLTSMYGDMRKIAGADGGLQIRGLTETTMGLYLSSIVTTVTSTKSNAADAAIILESGLKDTSSVQGHAADTNLVAIQNRFTTPKTVWLVDTDGDTWQSGTATVGQVLPTMPTAQTIAAGNTVAADVCGGLKRISSAGAVSTSTSDTFTTPAAGNSGCILHVCNVGTQIITLDNNANFKSAAGADVILTADNCVLVGSTGAGGAWYQMSPVSVN